MSNPTGDICNAIWTTLEDSAAFVAAVSVGNRIKYEDNPKERDALSYADTPLVTVVPSRTKWWPFSDSSNTGLDIEWSIQVVTGEREWGDLLDLHWIIGRAMLSWSTDLSVLVYPAAGVSGSATYVKSCRALLVKHDLEDRKLNQGTRGWSEVWKGQVKCFFNTAVLQAYTKVA